MVYCSGLENLDGKPQKTAENAESCGFYGAQDATFTNRSAGCEVAKVGTPTLNIKAYPPRVKAPVVYFAQAENGLIKIGNTSFIEDRLFSLRMGSPIAINLLATTKGDRAREKQFHAKFAAHRLHGEWFRPHPEILDEVARLNLRSARRIARINATPRGSGNDRKA